MGKSIIVVGAGIVGVSTAIWLQRSGHTVTLIDRDGPASGTSHGNAGVLAAGAIIPVTTPGILRRAPGMLMDRNKPLFLRWSYLPRLVPFLRKYLGHATKEHVEYFARNMAYLLADSYEQHQALSAGTGAETYLHDDDYCYGYSTRAAFEADGNSWKIRKENGVSFELLRGADHANYDPIFEGQFDTVVRLHRHGRISDPGAYVRALSDHFVEQGGTLSIATITDVEMDGGECKTLVTDQGEIQGDHVVFATGAWSKPLSKKLGLRHVALESERGYHVELVNPTVMPKSPTMVAEGQFVVTPMEGRIRCAGVVEFGGLDAGPSRAPFDMMHRHIARVLPNVSYDKTVEWMGHRPATTDSLPLLGPATKNDSAYVAFGHQHVGLTAGPKSGRLISNMISGDQPNQDLSAFDPARIS